MISLQEIIRLDYKRLETKRKSKDKLLKEDVNRKDH